MQEHGHIKTFLIWSKENDQKFLAACLEEKKRKLQRKSYLLFLSFALKHRDILSFLSLLIINASLTVFELWTHQEPRG